MTYHHQPPKSGTYPIGNVGPSKEYYSWPLLEYYSLAPRGVLLFLRLKFYYFVQNNSQSITILFRTPDFIGLAGRGRFRRFIVTRAIVVVGSWPFIEEVSLGIIPRH